jgi:ArsR family transcriptional regulator, arsenate/arsenite/antimonite-responsive transcriptional repressor
MAEVGAMRKTSEFFKTLGDETRLKMLWLLMNHEELCVCDFMKVLGCTQSKASRHLRSLYHAGLVEDRRLGLWNYYKLGPIEKPSVRAHLDALKQTLVTTPESKELLDELHQWFQQKERGDLTSCSAPT